MLVGVVVAVGKVSRWARVLACRRGHRRASRQNQVDQQEHKQRAFHPSRSPVAVKPPNGIRFSRSREAAVGWKRGLGAAPLQLLEAGADLVPPRPE
jgi:hypothetical protein